MSTNSILGVETAVEYLKQKGSVSVVDESFSNTFFLSAPQAANRICLIRPNVCLHALTNNMFCVCIMCSFKLELFF